MSKTRVIIDAIRRMNEITERAAGVFGQAVQNKPATPPAHPCVAKPMIQNRAETAVITVAITIKIRPDTRISFFRRY